MQHHSTAHKAEGATTTTHPPISFYLLHFHFHDNIILISFFSDCQRSSFIIDHTTKSLRHRLWAKSPLLASSAIDLIDATACARSTSFPAAAL